MMNERIPGMQGTKNVVTPRRLVNEERAPINVRFYVVIRHLLKEVKTLCCTKPEWRVLILPNVSALLLGFFVTQVINDVVYI